MTRDIISSEKGILIAAIAVSVMIHLFWVSAIKIVTGPSTEAHVKFSKVSFLGTAPGKGGVELKMAPKAASFLENRYRRKVDEMRLFTADSRISFDSRAKDVEMSVGPDEKAMSHMIEEALDSPKLEPPRPADAE